MNAKKISLPLLLLILLMLPAFYGCPRGNPTITLTVTDCETGKITITDSTRVSSRSGNQWQFSTTITVKCDGKIAKDAEIKIKFWFKDAFKRKTNSKGQISYHDNLHSNPKGQKFKVTIKGKNNKDKTEEFTVK